MSKQDAKASPIVSGFADSFPVNFPRVGGKGWLFVISCLKKFIFINVNHYPIS